MELNMYPIIVYEFSKKQEICDYIEKQRQSDEKLDEIMNVAYTEEGFEKALKSNIFKYIEIRNIPRIKLIYAFIAAKQVNGVKEILRKFYPKIYKNCRDNISFYQYIKKTIESDDISLSVILYCIIHGKNALNSIKPQSMKEAKMLSYAAEVLHRYLYIENHGSPSPNDEEKAEAKRFKKEQGILVNGRNPYGFPSDKDDVPIYNEIKMMLLRQKIRLEDIRSHTSNNTDAESFLVAISNCYRKDIDRFKEIVRSIDADTETMENIQEVFINHCADVGVALYMLSKLASLYDDGREYAAELIKSNEKMEKELERFSKQKDKEIEKCIEKEIKKRETQEEIIKKLQVENDKLRISLSDAQEKINFLEELEETISLSKDKEFNDESTLSDAPDDEEKYPEGTVLWGGHERWQKFFIEKHPEINKVFDGNGVHDVQSITEKIPLILINIAHMSHKSYYKYMPIIKKKNIPYKFLI